MKIERHNTGPRMSKAVIHGDTVYSPASSPIIRKARVPPSRPKAFCRIDGFLASAGTDKTKLLCANIWITDMTNFAEMNAVWDGCPR